MSTASSIGLRAPRFEDGLAVSQLIQRCPPLDTNSTYCNFLQCCHFSATSVAAEADGQLVGFISGYRQPDSRNTLFIWQVAVDERARGHGLASKMIRHILDRPENQNIEYIETTITPDNDASWALFRRLADALSKPLQSRPFLDSKTHFAGQSKSEALVQIGPLSLNSSESNKSH